MAAPLPSRLDAGQVLQGSFDEASGRLRTDAEATIVNAEIDVEMDSTTSSVAIGDAVTGDTVVVTPAGELSVITDANTSSVEVFQIDPDGLNTNAHLQVAGADVSSSNPVPVSFPAGSDLATAANQTIANNLLTTLDSNISDINDKLPNLGQTVVAGSISVVWRAINPRLKPR